MRRSNLEQHSSARTLAGAALILALASCGSPPPATPTPEPSRIAGAPRLGPTSTNRPASPSPPPQAPTATLIPLSPVTQDDWIRGPFDAPASLVVYCDFQAPACARLAAVVSEILAAHPRDVNLVYRPVPILPTNDKAGLAGRAVQAAAGQTAFWSMYDALYERWKEWSDLTPDAFRTWLLSAAEDAGLDVQRFEADLDDPENLVLQERAYAQAVSAGIPSVPFVFLNGDLYRLSLDRSSLEAAVRLAVLSSRRFVTYPPLVIDPDRDYTAHLLLNIGEVVVQLLPRSAPKAVNSFVFLAEQGWYDESPIFRVVPGRLVETGDPSGTGIGDAGYFFETEIDPAYVYDHAGVAGMTNSGAETNSSIFFITLGPVPEFDGERTVFGQVAEGLDFLQALDERDPLADLLQPAQAELIRITLEVK